MAEIVHRMLPLYEGKMIHHYDHRWATYEADGSPRDVTLQEKQNPNFVVMPRYWVREEVVNDRLPKDRSSNEVVGIRSISNPTNFRTLVATLLRKAATGNSLPIISGSSHAVRLAAILSSFVVDYVTRLKVGGSNLNFFLVQQFPVLDPASLDETRTWSLLTVGEWIDQRASYLLSSQWDEEIRTLLRAELDAAMFLLYGVERADVDYIMDTFPIAKRQDEAQVGEYRTKRLILEIYDQLAEAERTGVPYESPSGDLVVAAGESDV